MNHCVNGGTLVDAATPLPEDVGDYYAHPALGLIGCNRLYCRRCASFVRQAPGLGFAAPGLQVDLAALYERPVLPGGPELMATYPGRRLYLCRCSRWLEAFTRPVKVSDPDPLTDPTMPWACAGHPDILFPGDIDGVFIRSADDVVALARRALEGFAGPEARPEEAAAWTARLYARMQGTPTAEGIASVAAAAIADADPAVRARALRFFEIFPLPVGVSRVLALLDGERAGHDDDALWSVAARFVAGNERVRELARREAQTPGRGRAVYAALAEHDGPWLVEHAAAVVHANPGAVGALLDAAWRRHDDPRAVVRRVAALPGVPAEVLAEFAVRQRLDAADRALLAR